MQIISLTNFKPCWSAVALVGSTKSRRRRHKCCPLNWTDWALVEEDNEDTNEETGIKGLLIGAVCNRGGVKVMANLEAIRIGLKSYNYDWYRGNDRVYDGSQMGLLKPGALEIVCVWRETKTSSKIRQYGNVWREMQRLSCHLDFAQRFNSIFCFTNVFGPTNNATSLFWVFFLYWWVI